MPRAATIPAVNPRYIAPYKLRQMRRAAEAMDATPSTKPVSTSTAAKKPPNKTLVYVGIGTAAVGLGVVAYLVLRKKASTLKPGAATLCPDGTQAPGGNIGNCPTLGNSLGPSSNSGQTYNYTGTPTSSVQAAAQALAAVDPCQCANVGLVRAFQLAAGLTVTGQTDGRYGSNTAAVLGQYVSNAPAGCATQSWWGADGTYSNPNCPGDPGP